MSSAESFGAKQPAWSVPDARINTTRSMWIDLAKEMKACAQKPMEITLPNL